MTTDDITLKISILKQIQNRLTNNKQLEEAREEADVKQKQYNTQNELYQQKIAELKKVKSISHRLNLSRTEWDKQIADQIRQPLQKIYRRINRHTNIDNINLLVEGRKPSS